MPRKSLITLDAVRPGQHVTVTAVHGDGPITQRLAEMGVVAGAVIQVIRYAPLGDPMEIALDGYRLSLRRTEAATVTIHCDNASS